MTEEQMEVYRKVFEEDRKKRIAQEDGHKQEAIKRRAEGKSLVGDYLYLHENQKDKIAHQDEKIAHPDAMTKTQATILLIVGMIGSLIFKQWYLIWAILIWWYFGTDRV